MAEFALALTLLSGAGMALHSFWNLTQIDLGVRTDNIVTGWLETRNMIHAPERSAPTLVSFSIR